MSLTNPNLDSFDVDSPAGPDPGLYRFAFAEWHRVSSLTRAPRLQADTSGLPPTVIAVGTDDSLAPEARGREKLIRPGKLLMTAT